MDQSVIILALAKRQELRRQAEVNFRLKAPNRLRLSFIQGLQQSLAVILIDLGTSLKVEGSISSEQKNKTISLFLQG